MVFESQIFNQLARSSLIPGINQQNYQIPTDIVCAVYCGGVTLLLISSGLSGIWAVRCIIIQSKFSDTINHQPLIYFDEDHLTVACHVPNRIRLLHYAINNTLPWPAQLCNILTNIY